MNSCKTWGCKVFFVAMILMAALVAAAGTEAAADTSTTATLSTNAGDPVYGPFSVSARFSPPILALQAGDLSTTNAAVSGLAPLTTQHSLACFNHHLILRPNGTVVAWGNTNMRDGTCVVVPTWLTNVTSVGAGDDYSMALRNDGSVVMWGSLNFQKAQPPAGLSNVVAISAGYIHCMALKADGTIAAWGYNANGECNIPGGLGRVVAVAAGGYHSLALRENGTVAAWGWNDMGQLNVPAGLSGVVAIAAGWRHSMALTSSGQVVVWGSVFNGSIKVPAGLSDVVAIAAGHTCCLALRANGTVVAWGDNSYGQAVSPADLTDAVEICSGALANMARRRDGSVYYWGTLQDGFPGGVARGPSCSEYRFDLAPRALGLAAVQLGAGVTTDTLGLPNIASNLLQRLYIPYGALLMRIDPPKVNTLGAKWRRMGTTTWLSGNTTETNVIPGPYTVEFKDVPNWIKPASQDLVVTSSQVIQASAAYDYQLSSLKVELAPAGAVTAGALWRRTGTSTWMSGDYEEMDLQPGGGTVEFKPLTGWTTPANQAVTLTKGQMTLTTGTYVRQTGSLCVTLTPPEAIAAGAKWRRVGTTAWLDGGSTEAGLPTGNYTVEFQSLPLWLTPVTQVVAVNPNQATAANAVYVPCLSQMSWASYVGGSGLDCINAVAVDNWGDIYVVGTTSTGSGWISGGGDTSYNGGTSDAFVAKITASAQGRIAWSTYLGGAGADQGKGIAIDQAGNIYVTGTTSAGSWAAGGYNTTFGGPTDAFVARLSSSGRVIWSTYLGGAQDEAGNAVAVDAAGNVYATGTTSSEGWVHGGFKTSIGSGSNIPSDAYVVKLTPNGQHLWSTYLGGSDVDEGNAITVDAAGKILVAGSMSDPGWCTSGKFNGLVDAFAAKLTPAGACEWSVCLGGYGFDSASAIAADRAGNVIVAGETASPGWTAGGFDTTLENPVSQNPDAFVARLSPGGVLQWSTYLGGSDVEWVSGVVADAQGNICVAGETYSVWAFNGFDTTYGGFSNPDGFVAKLTPTGGHAWSTYLGDKSYDTINAIALDASGDLYVAGETSASYGWISGGWDLTFGGSHDGFLARIHDLRPLTAAASLLVGISPAAAADGGAQWRQVGASEWLDGGLSAINLAPGTFNVEFKPLAGWTAPKSQAVTITAGQAQLTSGTYVRQTGTLKVTLTPAGAVKAGAQWRRVGTATWLGSGTSEVNIPTGSVQVEFKNITGWKRPADAVVTVNYNQTAQAARQYGDMHDAVGGSHWLSYD